MYVDGRQQGRWQASSSPFVGDQDAGQSKKKGKGNNSSSRNHSRRRVNFQETIRHSVYGSERLRLDAHRQWQNSFKNVTLFLALFALCMCAANIPAVRIYALESFEQSLAASGENALVDATLLLILFRISLNLLGVLSFIAFVRGCHCYLKPPPSIEHLSNVERKVLGLPLRDDDDADDDKQAKRSKDVDGAASKKNRRRRGVDTLQHSMQHQRLSAWTESREPSSRVLAASASASSVAYAGRAGRVGASHARHSHHYDAPVLSAVDRRHQRWSDASSSSEITNRSELAKLLDNSLSGGSGSYYEQQSSGASELVPGVYTNTTMMSRTAMHSASAPSVARRATVGSGGGRIPHAPPPLSWNAYRTSYVPPKTTSRLRTDKFSYSNTEAALAVLQRLRVDPDEIEEWSDRMKQWISKTIVVPLVRSLDSLDSENCPRVAVPSGNPVRVVKSTSHMLDSFGQGEPNDMRHQQKRLLIHYVTVPGFDHSSVVERIRSLAEGGVLSNFAWDKTRRRSSEVPPDAQIIIHLFCTYMNLTLPPVPMYRHPFTDRHFLRRPADPADPRLNLDVAIYQAHVSRPHFEVVFRHLESTSAESSSDDGSDSDSDRDGDGDDGDGTLGLSRLSEQRKRRMSAERHVEPHRLDLSATIPRRGGYLSPSSFSTDVPASSTSLTASMAAAAAAEDDNRRRHRSSSTVASYRVWECVHGRQNLFHALVLFLYFVKTRRDGYLSDARLVDLLSIVNR
jgi:Cytochrome B561, N terminal